MCTSFISSTLVSLFLFTFMIRRQPSSAHTYTLFPYTTLYRSLIDEPAAVLTYTADWRSYHPAPPLYVGFVQYANGARILMEVVDVGPEGIQVGPPLKLTYRIKERDRTRGYSRYFWKPTPVAKGAYSCLRESRTKIGSAPLSGRVCQY